uniref:Pyrin domain-containing protein n=1 Tax=Acanthochromis polyacanthus TaxID=80966 RepID=A0A3Q1ERJ4_9TELE
MLGGRFGVFEVKDLTFSPPNIFLLKTSKITLEIQKTLDNLSNDDLKAFHFNLQNTTHKQKRIPRSKLENKNSRETATLLTDRYEHMEALQVTMQTLRNINQWNLALELERDTAGCWCHCVMLLFC